VKLGILGGSFNPVHLGHLFLADTVISALKLDRVVFVPAYCSPFKLDAENMASGTDNRLDMLAAAVNGDSRYAIDDCEIKRKGVSYTIDTIEDIISRYVPEGKPALIIGDDLILEFPKWKDSDRILKLADVVIARRVKDPKGNHLKQAGAFHYTPIDNEVMDISSSLVRAKVSEGSSWRSLVPSGVTAVIEDKRLYGYASDVKYKNSSDVITMALIQRVESAIQETLTIERFLHSRNTALLASDLCRRFGFNPAEGYLAGIAHDYAKQLDNKQLIKIVKNDGTRISSLERDKPNLLHGKAAAILLRERFSIHNENVLEAVACHTSGNENMGPIAKVVYIADKTESSRNIDPALRKMCVEADLDSILFTVLEKTILKLQARQLDLSEDTLLLLNKIRDR